ncbi:ADP-ribosylation factor-binding protein GGA3 [Octopus bimaculoides]|uniref:ADP-ribosylation factor-binding protein GGA3 n=1 Tax=Octopus bimaculoides TaxID=37653 RepID=UPI00071D0014|nr:ADP-ribosylation factor-binding protein GGA3 [Octopus bimaculoides]|eukprot:XP_014785844.1 PREDICTED: ADP-ribosylation factor-binding protein GGA3-like [Octopus bimaculoides]
MASEVETLDSLLNKATNPANREEDWDHMMMFCDRVNKDIEGPMISVRLLAHKLQSPQEREALFALLTLETCVKNCGSRFQSEIGKFRFLNEIIKVVSPKYLGTRTSENVKKRCIELMYSWTRDLSHEPKIGEAYAMLKTQGIVKEDPAYIDKNLNANPAPPRPKNALFEDDEKARLLSRLLKSKNPEDLQAANRLIKNMVQQDADRIDKISKRVSELETINNNVSVLSEMLEHYGTESASQSDRDTMKELYETLEKLRPNLFRLASDTDEQDNDGIADILKANDEVMKVMNQYKMKVEGSSEFGTNHTLLDLGFDQTTQSPNKTKANLASMTTPVGASILDEQLLALGLSDPPDMKPVATSTQPSSNLDNSSSSTIDQLSDIFGSVNVEPSDKLSNVITASSTTDATPSPIHSVFNMGATNTSLNSGMAQAPVFPNFTATSQTPSLASGSFVSAPLKNKEPISLSDVFVPLESVEPGTTPPINAYEKDGLKIVIHFAKNKPRPDVLVLVVSVMNSGSIPIRNFLFQAAVPKMMKVKLQPPSATDLPSFNPILPPAAITQVMLLANPLKVVSMKIKNLTGKFSKYYINDYIRNQVSPYAGNRHQMMLKPP